jgi:prepilin-type N-terminal cleavage/methylation domain-containing protein
VKRSSRSAFTLLEILLAIALVALLAGALIAGSVSLLNDKPLLPQEVFWQASHAARKTALQNAAVQGGHDVRLTFDDKQKAFIADDGVNPQTFPIAKPPADLGVTFFPTSGSTGSSPGGGSPEQSAPVPYVTFYGDGTCTPFDVQFRSKASAQLLEIDPWTCAQILKAPPGP